MMYGESHHSSHERATSMGRPRVEATNEFAAWYEKRAEARSKNYPNPFQRVWRYQPANSFGGSRQQRGCVCTLHPLHVSHAGLLRQFAKPLLDIANAPFDNELLLSGGFGAGRFAFAGAMTVR